MRPCRTSSVRAVFSLTFVLLLVGLGVGGGPVLAQTESSGRARVLPASQVAVQLADNGRNIDVPAGNLLVLVLPANPSTGYGWQLDGASATMLNAAQPEFQIEDGGQHPRLWPADRSSSVLLRSKPCDSPPCVPVKRRSD